MWSEPTPSGDTIYRERYKHPLTGKLKKYSVTLKGKDTAKNRKIATQELERKFQDDCSTLPDNITLGELQKRYAAYQRKTFKASTYRRNEYVLETLVPLIGSSVLLKNLTAGYIRDKLLERTDNPVTLNEYVKRIKAMLRWAYESDYLESTVIIDKLKRFSISKNAEVIRPEDKYLEPEQLEALFDYMEKSKEQWYLLTRFLVLSGLRIGEAIALEKSDISETDITINKTFDVVNREITTPKTSASNRQVFIQPELAEVIKDIKRFNRNRDILIGCRSSHFFHTDQGERISYQAYSKYMRETTEKVIGDRRTPHCLRHTHASLLFADGVSIDTISRRLGHENSKITREIYLHIIEKVKEKDREILSTKRILKAR